MGDADCVFCKIVAGTVPAAKVCEDDRALAFMDVNPANPGHCLVVSKEHAADLLEVSAPALDAVMRMARRVARVVSAGLRPDGLNLLQANGRGAAQSVGHFHVHVLPRRLDDRLAMNWPLVPGDRGSIEQTADLVRAALRP